MASWEKGCTVGILLMMVFILSLLMVFILGLLGEGPYSRCTAYNGLSLWILGPKHKLGVSPTERVGLTTERVGLTY